MILLDLQTLHIIKQLFILLFSNQRLRKANVPHITEQEKKQYIDRPKRTWEHLELYTPNYTDILISKSEMTTTNIMKRLDINFSEPACKPRAVIVNMKDEMRANSREHLYLVLILLSSEGDFEKYRLVILALNWCFTEREDN